MTNAASVPRIRFFIRCVRKKRNHQLDHDSRFSEFVGFFSQNIYTEYVNHVFRATEIYWCARQRISMKNLSCLWLNSKNIKRINTNIFGERPQGKYFKNRMIYIDIIICHLKIWNISLTPMDF